jgi:ArsR family transcriptional regulator, arsenate/arsenite/antimonite-responsive transcriptional repressor
MDFMKTAQKTFPSADTTKPEVEAIARCCPPLLNGRITTEDTSYLAAIFRVLGEPARLQILSLISAQPSQEVCACELVETLGLAQPTVSHHLKVLYEAGLLTKERRGTWIYYRILPEKLAMLRDALS